VVLPMQQILDDGGGVRLGRVGLNIGEPRTAEIAKDEMHFFIEGWGKRRMGHDAHSLKGTRLL
jgi:hypothetical protein